MSSRGGHQEQTFRSYSDEDAAQYAQARLPYSDELYRAIVAHHVASGGGRLETVVDVGCRPGIATLRLAEYSGTVVGLDASRGVIHAARERRDARVASLSREEDEDEDEDEGSETALGGLYRKMFGTDEDDDDTPFFANESSLWLDGEFDVFFYDFPCIPLDKAD